MGWFQVIYQIHTSRGAPTGVWHTHYMKGSCAEAVGLAVARRFKPDSDFIASEVADVFSGKVLAEHRFDHHGAVIA